MVKSEQNVVQSSTTPYSKSSSSSLKKKFKGVRMRSWGSWVSEIRAPNQKTRIWLGSYSTPEAAARAYDAALLCLKGPSANLNFPISHYHLMIPDTPILSPKSIQRVAAAAAANSTTTSNDNHTTPPPPSSTSTSSSATSSPSITSSPYPNIHIKDDISLVPSSEAYKPYGLIDEQLSWYNFESPKYTDMLNGVLFDPVPMMEDVYEEGDIRLWSFC